jgi:hypothetical protein
MGQYKTIWDTCATQIACDGHFIKPGRTMCGFCERAVAKRQALKTKLLKGERHLATEEAKSLRRKEEKRHG